MVAHLVAEISAAAMRWNLELFRSRLPARTKLCAVVKADAYGHCVRQLLPVIVPYSDSLAVATANEALDLRQLGYAGQLLLLLPASHLIATPRMLDELAARKVAVTVGGLEDVRLLDEATRRCEHSIDTHVKVDTGMTRNGARPTEVGALFEALAARPALRLLGVYTHVAALSGADRGFVAQQLRSFASALEARPRTARLVVHAANSGAAMHVPESRFDMVRPGLALYGYQPWTQVDDPWPLRPALRLCARLMTVKDVPAGTTCGYGMTFTFSQPARVGLVPIGYADGYSSRLSNLATMRVAGRDVPVRGRVSMDQTLLELTCVPEAKVGTEVEVISSDPTARNSVESLARLAGTSSYELLCRLGGRIERKLAA